MDSPDKIVITLSNEEAERRYTLAAMRDMYSNISDLEEIYNICRRVIKHGANAEKAIDEIKELSWRDYEG